MYFARKRKRIHHFKNNKYWNVLRYSWHRLDYRTNRRLEEPTVCGRKWEFECDGIKYYFYIGHFRKYFNELYRNYARKYYYNIIHIYKIRYLFSVHSNNQCLKPTCKYRRCSNRNSSTRVREHRATHVYNRLFKWWHLLIGININKIHDNWWLCCYK